MLELVINDTELFDTVTNTFVAVKKHTLILEHSLISISKWEARFKKPFLTREVKTLEETRYYIKCMTLNRNVDDNVYLCLTNGDIDKVNSYIEDPMSATKPKKIGSPSRETITSELIYYWMIALNIPVEFEKWHINRLLTLIEVCNIKNAPPKKMTTAQRRALNNQRKARLHTRG